MDCQETLVSSTFWAKNLNNFDFSFSFWSNSKFSSVLVYESYFYRFSSSTVELKQHLSKYIVIKLLLAWVQYYALKSIYFSEIGSV